MSRALVLSGGGVKGAYQLGVLRKWLFEDGIDYDVFSGVSVGALNSAVLAQVPYGRPQEAYLKLASVWDNVDNSSIRKDWNFFGKVATLWKGHVYNSEPLRRWVQNGVDQEALERSGKKLLVGATCLDTGLYKVARESTPDLWKWVYASAAFPLFFKESFLENSLWVDGGVRNVTPLGEVLRLGVDEVDVVLASNPYKIKFWDHRKKAVWQKAFRVLDIMMAEITLTDLHAAGLQNHLSRLGADVKPVKIRLIYPEEELVTDSLDFDPKAIFEMHVKGYRQASEERGVAFEVASPL